MSTSGNVLSSGKILEFYRFIEAAGAENHGLLITVNGEKLFEHYVYPYSEDTPHTLFSVTKSLVSTAVGFAISEGLINLDTRVASYFGEYRQSPGTDRITVRQLLTMHSGKKFSFLQDMTGDYVEIFMKAGFRKTPGFLYSNNDVHILSALLQKVTGQPVVDYLTSRLFEPMGINKPEWETDKNGICVGGTGCYLRLKDLVAIVQCYADGGVYNGKQLIPEFWTREATKKQVDITPTPYSDGYGYLFWTNGNDFAMNGMFSQIITYYPESGMIVGYTNSSVDDRPLMCAAETYLRNALVTEDKEKERKALEKYLKEKDENCIGTVDRFKVPKGAFSVSALSDFVSSLFFPAGLIPRSISSSMAKRPGKGINNLSFSQKEEGCLEIRWTEDGDTVKVNCGLDGTPRMSECSLKGYDYIIWSYGYWYGNILNLTVKPINTLATQKITMEFTDGAVKVRMKDTPGFTEFILHNMTTVPIFEKSRTVKRIAEACMKLLLKTAYVPMTFKKQDVLIELNAKTK